MRVRALNPAGNGSAATAVVGEYGMAGSSILPLTITRVDPCLVA